MREPDAEDAKVSQSAQKNLIEWFCDLCETLAPSASGCPNWLYPPRRIMSKNSWLFLVAFMFLSISSMDSISSMLYMN
jgi:hypothetical protein